MVLFLGRKRTDICGVSVLINPFSKFTYLFGIKLLGISLGSFWG